MAKKKIQNEVISPLTTDNMDLKIISKLELTRDHSYLILFKIGTIPFEQAKNLAELLADAGFKTLFVAVQDTEGITVVEREEEVKAAVVPVAKVAKAKKTFKKQLAK